MKQLFISRFCPRIVRNTFVMLYSYHEKRHETLAEYYYRTNRYLFGSVKVDEYNPETNEFHVIE